MSSNAFIRLNQLEARYLDFFRHEAPVLVSYVLDREMMTVEQVQSTLQPIGDFFGWLDARMEDIRGILSGADSLIALTEVLGGVIEGIGDYAEQASHASQQTQNNPLAPLLAGLSGLSGLSGQIELAYLSEVLPNPALLNDLQQQAQAIQTEIQTLLAAYAEAEHQQP